MASKEKRLKMLDDMVDAIGEASEEECPAFLCNIAREYGYVNYNRPNYFKKAYPEMFAGLMQRQLEIGYNREIDKYGGLWMPHDYESRLKFVEQVRTEILKSDT